MPSCLKYSIVLGLCKRPKIVRKPVEIVSALSLVVDLTDVNKAISSSMSPPAVLNAPPVLLMASTISVDSTANCLETELIDSRTFPARLTLNSKVCITAIKPSVVLVRLSNVANKSVLARIVAPFAASLKLKPV